MTRGPRKTDESQVLIIITNLCKKNDYTYGFYLYHMILINILVEFGIDSVSTIQEGILITIIVAAITLFISIVSQNIVAVPINRMLRSKH